MSDMACACAARTSMCQAASYTSYSWLFETFRLQSSANSSDAAPNALILEAQGLPTEVASLNETPQT